MTGRLKIVKTGSGATTGNRLKLSAASIHSLKRQGGGPINAVEIAEFEGSPNLSEVVCVRHLEGADKIEGMAKADCG
jgi:predicted HD phosphohydrolase